MKARLSIFILLFSMLFSGSSVALIPSNLHFDKLDNGLTIMVMEDPQMQDVTMKVCVKGGAITEPPRFDGFSHLYEHLFFNLAAKDKDMQSFRETVRANGGTFRDTTGFEHASYTLKLPRQMVDKGFRFLNQLVRYPQYDIDEVKRAKQIIQAEYQKSQSHPLFALNQDMIKRLWAPFANRKNRFGNPDAIALATPKMLDTFRRSNLRPRQTLMVIAGDVEHETMVDKAYSTFDDWPKIEDGFYSKYERPNFPRLNYSEQIITQTESAHQPVFLACYQGPGTNYGRDATYPAKVFANILDQPGSKFKSALVDPGLAKSVSVRYQPLKHVSSFRVTIVPDSGKIEEMHDTLLAEMKKWDQDSYYTDTQFKKAKRQIVQDRSQIKSNTDIYLNKFTSTWASTSVDYYLNFTDSIRAVDREDVNIVTREYLTNRPYTGGLVIDSASRHGLNVDSFFTTTPQIDDLTFRYKSNSAQLKTKQDSQHVLGLIQWMKINPEARIQINGMADKSEFLKIRNKKYLSYMDTLEGFSVPHRLNMPKMNVRLDILRSLRIVKALTDAGIEPGRLAGSGRLEEGEAKEDVNENKKATVRLKNW
jgi:zinc protease